MPMTQVVKPYPSRIGGRGAPQFIIRFPSEQMRDRIRSEADKNGRSMNAEIIHMLDLCLNDQVLASDQNDTTFDHIAEVALEAIMSNPRVYDSELYSETGMIAYRAAKSMIEFRNEAIPAESKTSALPDQVGPQFTLRFPSEAMRNRIHKKAEENGRSINAEIIHMLGLCLDSDSTKEKTLRDNLAIAALKGSLSNPEFDFDSWLDSVGVMAYEAADALILARAEIKLKSHNQEAAPLKRASPKSF